MAVLVKILADVDNSVEPQKMLLASYSGHLLCNLMSSLNENEQLSALRLVLNHVSNCLRFVVTPDLLTLADDISKFDENGSGEDASDKIALTSKLLNTSLTAKRVALETLANLCSENDWDDAEGMEFEEDDSEPDEDLKDVAEGIEDSIGFSHPETESMIVQLNLLGDTINHLEPPNEEMKTELSKLSYGREVLDNVFSIQSNALVAIGNLVQSLDKEHLSDSSLLTQRLMALIQSEISKKEQVLIAEAISVTRSLVTTGILTVPSTDVPMFCQLVTTSSDPLLRISCIKILGIIGSKSEVCDEVEAITSFLLEICESGNQSASLDVRSEAIDNVMDMHSEDTKTDSIVIKLNLLRRLEAINKAMRAELKADKRKTKRKNPIIETVLLNLTRFIKYKISMVGK
ncbi:HEAT repeat-containing protein 3 [Halotydeus destructor]|nr:HEAT repeat-containing protein 3 [Halotydeus destructor]